MIAYFRRVALRAGSVSWNGYRHPIARFALSVFCLLGVSSCGGGGPTEPTTTSLAGLWHGTSVEGNTDTWNREDMVLRENGTVTISEYEGRRNAPEDGTWSLSGNNITFTFARYGVRRGTVDGNRMNLTWDPGPRIRLVFVKQ